MSLASGTRLGAYVMLKDPEVGSNPASGAPTITVVANGLADLDARSAALK